MMMYEMPATWQQVRASSIPDAREIIARGKTVTPAELQVTLGPDVDLDEVREWMTENRVKARMYRRFAVDRAQFRTDTQRIGTTFVFSDPETAVLFRLRF